MYQLIIPRHQKLYIKIKVKINDKPTTQFKDY